MPSDYGILGVAKLKRSQAEGTRQVKDTAWSSGLSVTGDGTGMVAHAGSIGLRMLAENTGLTEALSHAMARRGFVPSVHDRGQVLTDVAVLLADGGEAISDIDVLRHQGQVLGPVASAPTVWRALDEVTDARRRKIHRARAGVRRHVWAQLAAAGGVPASRVAGTDLGEMVVLDVDATIVVTHSEKELEPPEVSCRFFLSQEGWRYAKEDRSRGQGAGVAVGA